MRFLNSESHFCRLSELRTFPLRFFVLGPLKRLFRQTSVQEDTGFTVVTVLIVRINDHEILQLKLNFPIEVSPSYVLILIS